MKPLALLSLLLLGACFHSRMPAFHPRDPATKKFSDQVLPGILAVSATFKAHILEPRCEKISDRWPAVLLKPDPDADEKYCFGLNFKLDSGPIEKNPEQAKKLLADMVLFACSFTPAPFVFARFGPNGAALAQNQYLRSLWKRCYDTGSFAIEPNQQQTVLGAKPATKMYATTSPLTWLDWALLWHTAIEVLEQEISVAEGGDPATTSP